VVAGLRKVQNITGRLYEVTALRRYDDIAAREYDDSPCQRIYGFSLVDKVSFQENIHNIR